MENWIEEGKIIKKVVYTDELEKVLPGFEPGLREVNSIRIPCDNRYTIGPLDKVVYVISMMSIT